MERKSVLLRISPDLWDELARWAAEELRSTNGQIEFLLRRAVDDRLGRRGGGGEDRSDPRASTRRRR